MAGCPVNSDSRCRSYRLIYAPQRALSDATRVGRQRRERPGTDGVVAGIALASLDLHAERRHVVLRWKRKLLLTAGLRKDLAQLLWEICDIRGAEDHCGGLGAYEGGTALDLAAHRNRYPARGRNG